MMCKKERLFDAACPHPVPVSSCMIGHTLIALSVVMSGGVLSVSLYQMNLAGYITHFVLCSLLSILALENWLLMGELQETILAASSAPVTPFGYLREYREVIPETQ